MGAITVWRAITIWGAITLYGAITIREAIQKIIDESMNKTATKQGSKAEKSKNLWSNSYRDSNQEEKKQKYD